MDELKVNIFKWGQKLAEWCLRRPCSSKVQVLDTRLGLYQDRWRLFLMQFISVLTDCIVIVICHCSHNGSLCTSTMTVFSWHVLGVHPLMTERFKIYILSQSCFSFLPDSTFFGIIRKLIITTSLCWVIKWYMPPYYIIMWPMLWSRFISNSAHLENSSRRQLGRSALPNLRSCLSALPLIIHLWLNK